MRLHDTTPENYPVTEATIARAKHDIRVNRMAAYILLSRWNIHIGPLCMSWFPVLGD